MASITFDTFKFVDRLEKAGLSLEQTVAIVEAQRNTFAEALGNHLATKSDIARLENKIDNQELRITLKIGTMLVVMAGIIIAALKL